MRTIDRIYAYWGMVAGTTMGWDVPGLGYVRGFMPKHLGPLVDRGFRRMFIHRPFGDDSAATGEPMNPDARVEKTVPKAADFDRMVRHTPDIRYLAYMGSWQDPDYARQMREGQWAAWVRRNLDSLGGLLNAPNCDIGYDHSVTMSPGYESGQKAGQVPGFPKGAYLPSWAWLDLVARIKAQQGARVWLESVPKRDAPYQHDRPFVSRTFKRKDGSIQSEWTRSRPHDDTNYKGLSGNDDVAPSQWLTGPKLDLCDWIGKHPIGEYVDSIVTVLSRGPEWYWAGAVNYTTFTADELVAAVDARLETGGV